MIEAFRSSCRVFVCEGICDLVEDVRGEAHAEVRYRALWRNITHLEAFLLEDSLISDPDFSRQSHYSNKAIDRVG